RPPPRSTLFPYTTLFRSELQAKILKILKVDASAGAGAAPSDDAATATPAAAQAPGVVSTVKADGSKPFCDMLVIDDMENVAKRRSEEHTSELQSLAYLVC